MFRRKTVVLMVCTENICRSPMAEGLLRERLKQAGLCARVTVDSAGTRASNPGVRPDQRAQKVTARAGISLGGIKARRITGSDFECTDFIFAMDRKNLNDLVERCPPQHRHKISLLLEVLPDTDREEVPDPYFGSVAGFEKVLSILEQATEQLLLRLRDAD